MSSRTVTVETDANGRFTQRVEIGSHHLIADEPADVHGDDRGPAPTEWVLAGLGACTSMTIRMYAQHKKIDCQRVVVRLRGVASREGLAITREIELQGDLDDAQRTRLLEIANRCPVHRMLTGEIKITSLLVESAASDVHHSE